MRALSLPCACLLLLAWPAAAAAEPWRLHKALDAPDWLTLSGSFRTRYEVLDGQFRPGLDGSDQGVFLRTELFAEAHSRHFRIGAELIDARAYLDDRDSGVSADDINALEPVQAYIGVRGALAGVQTDLQVGRFTAELGSQRLIGRNVFRNTTNAYTGVRLDLKTEDSSLTFLYTAPQRRLPDSRAGVFGNDIQLDAQSLDQRFWGVFLHQNHLPFDLQGEAFVFRLAERDDPSAGFQTPDRRLYTGGVRLLRPPKPGHWDIELEGGLQRGVRFASANPALTETLSVRAAYAHLEVGYSFDTPIGVRVAALYDLGSGDENPADGQFNGFDSLFGPRRPDFGPRGLFNAVPSANVQTPRARLALNQPNRWTVSATYRAAWLDEARDAFAVSIADPSGQSSRFAGHLLDVTARVWLVPESLFLELGGAALLDSAFTAEAPNGVDVAPLFAFAETVWRF